jgi:hypothetical protein
VYLLLFGAVFAAQDMFLVDDRVQVHKTNFGATVTTRETSESVEKKIEFPPYGIYHNDELRASHLDRLTEYNRQMKQAQLEDGMLGNPADYNYFTCSERTSEGNQYFEFLPEFVGTLTPDNNSVTFTDGRCFKETTFTAEFSPSAEDFTEVIVTVQTRKPKSLLCFDWYLFGSLDKIHFEKFSHSKTYTLDFSGYTQDEIEDLRVNGLRLFMFCDGVIEAVESVINTLLLFLGGLSANPDLPILGSHVPPYMEEANVKFLNESMGW